MTDWRRATRSGVERVRPVIDVLRRLRSASSRGVGRQIALALAMVLFIGLAVAGLRSSDLTANDINWWLLCPTALLGPVATIVLNAVEFRAQARLVTVEVSAEPALRTSVLASAANLLPIPGAVLVRMTALTSRGVSKSAAAWTTAVVGQVWAAVSAFVASVGFASNGQLLVGLASLAIGCAFAASAAATHRRRFPDSSGWLSVQISAIEFGIVAVGAARLYLTFVAFDLDIRPSQVAALTVSSVVASAAGVFPGGLGIREALIGLAGGLVGVDLAATVVVASFDRAASLVVLGLSAGGLLASPKVRARKVPVPVTPPRMESDEPT